MPQPSTVLQVDPRRVDLTLVAGAGLSGPERAATTRATRATRAGVLISVVPGAYASRSDFDALTVEGRHVVRMRAATAVSRAPVVFSHWSAAVLHRLPVLRSRLDRMHVTSPSDDARHRVGLAHHVFPLATGEVVEIGGVLSTALGRTVVDIAGATSLEESVMAADAALGAGIPRTLLEAAAEVAGPRRSGRRIREAIAFAHPGGESAAESRMRVSAYRVGVEIPQLQRAFVLRDGRRVFADAYFPAADAVLEVDGDVKYLDPALGPRGAGVAVLAEKRREDDIRAQVRAFARTGWQESGSPVTLRPVLERIGVRPATPRPTFDDWCAVASAARPRGPLMG